VTHRRGIPADERELLAVYAAAERAEKARRRLLGVGVSAELMRIDDDSDEVTSLRAEMHEELTQSWIVPTAAFVATKESVKGIGLVGGIAILASLVVAIPLAFIDFGSTLAVRLIWFSIVAVALGATIGFIAGAGLGARRPAERMAAHRGVVLRVAQDTAALRELLVQTAPIRLDEVTLDSVPLETVVTEEQADSTGTVEEVAANLRGDDYHPRRSPGSDEDDNEL
jgi:hypothetical protein